MKMRIV